MAGVAARASSKLGELHDEHRLGLGQLDQPQLGLER